MVSVEEDVRLKRRGENYENSITEQSNVYVAFWIIYI